MEKMGNRKGELVSMNPKGADRMRLEFLIPARGLFGYRTEFLTDTKGEGVLSSVFHSYQPYKGCLLYTSSTAARSRPSCARGAK